MVTVGTAEDLLSILFIVLPNRIAVINSPTPDWK